jgi:hypothetical protein
VECLALSDYPWFKWRLIKYDQIKENEMGVACSTHGETRNAYKILVGKSEGKRPLEKLTSTWENNIKMDLREVEWVGVDCIHEAQDRDRWRALVITVMNLRSFIKCGKCLDY